MRNVTRCVATVLLFGGVALPALGQEKKGGVQPPDEYAVDVHNDLGILTLQSQNGAFKWWTDMRIFGSATGFWGGNKGYAFGNGAVIDEGEICFQFQWDTNWVSKMEYEFDSNNSWKFKDMYIAWTGWKHSQLRLGMDKVPWSQEALTTEKYLFMYDRPAYVDAFKPNRHTGVDYSRWGEHYSLDVGYYGTGANDPVDPNNEDQGQVLGARYAFAPILTTHSLVHFGVAAYRMTPKFGSGNTVSPKSGYETAMLADNMGASGKINNVDHIEVPNVEFAAQYRGLNFRGEYGQYNVKRYGGLLNTGFSGYYVEASWFPSGYFKLYREKRGEFGQVIPPDKKGLIEWIVRYSDCNLNDLSAGFHGGEGKITKLGFNYYVNYNLKFRASAAHVETDKYCTRPNDSFNSVETAFELCF